MSSQAQRVPAAQQTMRILSYLAGRQGPVPAASIATALGIPRSSIYQLLAAMREEGFVVHIPEQRLYGLGVKAAELSTGYHRHDALTRVGKPIVERLVDTARENGLLAVMHGPEVYYVVAERARHRPSLIARVGVRLPAHVTATGRVMMARMSKEQVMAYYPNREAFSAVSEHTDIRSPRELRSALEQTRERGYGLEVGTIAHDITTIAHPVLDHLERPVAAVGLAFLTDRISDDRFAELVEQTRDAAATLSERIGGPVAGSAGG